MIAKELQYRFHHYSLLVVVMSVLFTLYIFGRGVGTRIIMSLVIGLVYMGWGIWSHHNELRTTRLVLEYVSVGILGAVILMVLAKMV